MTSGSAKYLTQINYAFANVSNNTCVLTDAYADYQKTYNSGTSVDGTTDDASVNGFYGNFHQLQELKKLYPNIKIVMSIGGWTLSSGFSSAAQPANVQSFVSSCVNMFIKGNIAPGLNVGKLFDGIDIDWEYPGACGNTCSFAADDTQDYTALLAEFRKQMDAVRPGLILSIAAPAGQDKFSLIELNNIGQYVDEVNLMTYDMHGAWESTTNFSAPLYHDSADPSTGVAATYYGDFAVQSYVNGGVPAGKIQLGIPFYGRGWTGVGSTNNGMFQPASGAAQGATQAGINNYNTLVTMEPNFQVFHDAAADAMWMYNGTDLWTFDDPETVSDKANYINTQGLGGAMFWDLVGDTSDGVLIKTLANGLSTITPPPADFSVSTTPSSQTVTAGGSTSTTAMIGALNGSSNNVILSVSGLPSSATASFNPGSVSGSGSSALTVMTSSSTPPGIYTLTIMGTSGSLTHTASVTLTVTAGSSGTTLNMEVTFYGWLDNSPPGNGIAYPQIHPVASGTGTFADPITFATDRNEIASGTIVYAPFLQKYFMMEDDCVECDADWNTSKLRHIDLWTGGNSSSGSPLINCEDSLTQSSTQIIVNPPGTLTVDPRPLFDANTNACWPNTGPSTGPAPDFGSNVLIFDPSMSASTVQSQLDNVFNQQQSNQFGSNRYALLFKPGSYNANVRVGFYTQVMGLGQSPDDVTINGAVQSDAVWFQGNATQNFWRSTENLAVVPAGGTDMWAVSQASPFRRMHIMGDLVLSDSGWSSGGFISDSVIDGQVNSGSQQQWLTRNSQLGNWNGANWNMVFVGVNNAPAGSFPNPPYTVVNQTPVVREKPFLTIDSAGNYSVFVPALSNNSQGTTWSNGAAAGLSIPISQFYIAHEGTDTAATINAALNLGKNLLFTPGIYQLNDTIRVTRANTVVLGLGLATLLPQNGANAMTVSDVDGVIIAGLLFDAGNMNSSFLLQVGPVGSSADHSANPISLHDLFFRVGGADVGQASVSLQINSNNVIGDDFWLWRADHGNGVGWDTNTAANGLIVNGTNVTIYGLAVEHYQQYQTLWNGNGGQVYFYQSEAPYDVPDQGSWMNGSVNGFASYKVANSVTSHEAWGLGVYCFFSTDSSVSLASAIEAPNTSGINFFDMTTVSLGGVGEITHVINNTGSAANSSSNLAILNQYP